MNFPDKTPIHACIHVLTAPQELVSSPVPTYPLMRKNGLVNQVNFFCMLLQQCNLAMLKIICSKPAQKGMDTRVKIKNFTVVREVLHNNY